ncbi:hypothetical protein EDD27_2677 [Nonomuraea polychroma]|uniref:DUF7847 domain-containing protein n=1 Tax=Nonomuraea polychroma TaxID=46176 RepID=A0A438M3A7_9ACTN|nr:hypothetical protein [Nonomuraea polychroma]RVX40275.1 hypothetical protein EDD27_2677 [Nonomuraea polychroma]
MTNVPAGQPIVPIRPLSLPDIWTGAFRLLGRHPRPFFGSALVIGVSADLVLWAWDRLAGVTLEAPGTGPAQLAQASVLSLLLSAAVGLLAFALAEAVQAVLVVQAITGEPVRLRSALGLLRRRVRPVIGVAAALFTGPQMVMLLLAVAIAVIMWRAELMTAVLLSGGMSAALTALLPLYLLLMLFLVFAPVTAALEPVGTGGALRRSFVLAGRHLLRVVGVLVIALVTYALLGVAVSLPLMVVSVALAAASMRTGSAALATAAEAWTWVVDAVVAAMGAWFVAAVVLLYLDLRIRYEGLGTELWRRWTAHEQEAAGSEDR